MHVFSARFTPDDECFGGLIASNDKIFGGSHRRLDARQNPDLPARPFDVFPSELTKLGVGLEETCE